MDPIMAPFMSSAVRMRTYIRIFGNTPFDVEGEFPASPGYFRYNTWNAMQLVMQEMFETKKSPEDDFDILEKTAMFLMAFKSVLVKKGAPVRREKLEGWELMPPSAHYVSEIKQIARVFGGEYIEP